MNLTDAQLRERLGLTSGRMLQITNETNAAHAQLQELRRQGKVPNATLKPFQVVVTPTKPVRSPIEYEGAD
ncbi:MAG: hypothetical protein Q7S64_00090 [bacterium]|nr:hypothetical protein [bacterium]